MCFAGLRCFDIRLQAFDTFSSEGSFAPRGGGPEIAKPNHDEIDMRLGFDRNIPPTEVLKLGLDFFKLGFAFFDLKLRSLTSSQILSFVRLRENRSQNTKPSLRLTKPKPILLGFGVSKLGYDNAKLGFRILQLVHRSPAEPFTGLQRFRAFSTKPN